MRSNLRAVFGVVLVSLMATLCGCHSAPSGGWRTRFGWKAEEYFDDATTIALCHAIEGNDLQKIETLVVGQSVDVNTRGKDNMTPLLWAFSGSRATTFRKLLELGADPNIVFQSDFDTHNFIKRGDSVTLLAARTRHPPHFFDVMKQGGDVNVVNPLTLETPIHAVFKGTARDTIERAQLLIEMGADLDQINAYDASPVIEAVRNFGQYGLALAMLKAGADPHQRMPLQGTQLAHILLMEEEVRVPNLDEAGRASYERLVNWMKEHGTDFDQAREELARLRQ